MKDGPENDVSMAVKASSNGGANEAQEVGLGRRGSQLKGQFIFILFFITECKRNLNWLTYNRWNTR